MVCTSFNMANRGEDDPSIEICTLLLNMTWVLQPANLAQALLDVFDHCFLHRLACAGASERV